MEALTEAIRVTRPGGVVFAACERPGLVGASNHFLDVFQKL